MEDLKKGKTKREESSLSRARRNLVERNRRLRFKDLYSKLLSLISTKNSKLSVVDLVDQAITYTKQLEEKIEKLRERKELLVKENYENFEPIISMKSTESTLEVYIVSGLKKNFYLHQVISALEQEGAQVISTTYHNAGERVFYTIYSQAIISRIGIDLSSVVERLKKLIC